MKKRFIVLIVIGGAIIFFVEAIIVLSFPWLMIGIGGMMREDPPQPNVTYGEFPFSLVYEIDGSRIEITDTLVIEYLGVDWNEGLGKYNKWNVSYKGSTTEESLYLLEGFLEDGYPFSIRMELGSCEYYMGLEEDEPYYSMFNVKPGDIVISSRNEEGPLFEEELYDRFNIKIIEKTISKPITESQ